MAAVAAASLVAAVLAPLSGEAGATAGFTFTRIAGIDRYDTARQIALATFDTTDDVILATGENFPDALAGSYLAGRRGAAILLTQRTSLPSTTSSAITDLQVKRVTILGGPAAVDPAVENSLRQRTSSKDGQPLVVTRIAGATRYDTAQMVAQTGGAGSVGSLGTRRTAVLATGAKFADALAAGPIGYSAGGATTGFPILLSTPNALAPQTRVALDALDIEQVLLLGGNQAISDSVATELTAGGIVVRRIAGLDRYDTAAALWDLELTELAYDPTHVNLARGDDPTGFADALAFGPHGGREHAGILLTLPNQTVAATSNALAGHQSTLVSGHIAGGPAAVGSDVKLRYEKDAGSEGGEITLSSTSFPQGSSINGVIGSPTTLRDLSVTGCGWNNTHIDLTGATGAFRLDLPSDIAIGQCNLAFLIDRTNGQNTRQDIPITITTRIRTLTDAPDLQSAVLDPATNKVTFTFDEVATGAIPVTADFHLYAADGQQCTPLSVPSATGATVVAQFSAAPAVCDMQTVTTASTELGAVQDVTGRRSPESSVPLKTVVLPAGITNGPDLQTVTNLVSSTFARITADFTFDEPIANRPPPEVIVPMKFELIDINGVNKYRGIETPVVLSGNRTVRVTFDTLATNVPTSQIARGVVEPGAVRDTQGNLNPLNAAAVNQSGNTDGPDLVSARVSATDQVTFTFDEPVSVDAVDPADAPATDHIDPYDYKLYDISGGSSETAACVQPTTVPPPACRGLTAFRSATDNNSVVVQFPVNAVRTALVAGVDDELGASPGDPAPGGTSAARDPDDNKTNLDDAVPLQDVVLRGGSTFRPDLASVRITFDSLGNNTVVFLFDSSLETVNYQQALAEDFALYDGSGTRFSPVGGTGVFEDGGRAVRFGAGTPGSFTNTQATAAVLGAVNDSLGPVQFPEGSAAVTR